mgnify:CR=1 FL=1|tara:strand:- start:698 stop:958 length:261 start_codon:yes stop_codon:yes gene_type:complete
MHRQKHLDAFNELRRRLHLMEQDMEQKSELPHLVKRIESVYISTINELIDRGKKFLSLNPETEKTIVVAIDIDRYISILEKISIKE